MARTILLEEADHGGAARAPVEPGSQRSLLGVAPGLEEPIVELATVNAGRVMVHTRTTCSYQTPRRDSPSTG